MLAYYVPLSLCPILAGKWTYYSIHTQGSCVCLNEPISVTPDSEWTSAPPRFDTLLLTGCSVERACSKLLEGITKEVYLLGITMDVLQMDTHRYLNEFMHLSVSKVSQWHFKHASPLWCNDRHRHFSRIETRQCSAKSINLMRRRKLFA